VFHVSVVPVTALRVSITGVDENQVSAAAAEFEALARSLAVEVYKRPIARTGRLTARGAEWGIGMVLYGGKRALTRLMNEKLVDGIQKVHNVNITFSRRIFMGPASTIYHRVKLMVVEDVTRGENKFPLIDRVVSTIKSEARKYEMDVVGPMYRPLKSLTESEPNKRARVVELYLRSTRDVPIGSPYAPRFVDPIVFVIAAVQQLPEVRVPGRAINPPEVLQRLFGVRNQIEFSGGQVYVLVETVKGVWTRWGRLQVEEGLTLSEIV